MSEGKNKRLVKEYGGLMQTPDPTYEVKLKDDYILNWILILKPTKAPYKGKFEVQITFPVDYPFKPPQLSFTTRIYHPNIDTNGKACLALIAPENWKPTTMTKNIIEALLDLIENPQFDHPLRSELSDLYRSDKKKFLSNAEAETKKYAK